MKLIAFLIIFTCILIIRLFIFIIRSACKAVDFIEKPMNVISKNYNDNCNGFGDGNIYIIYINYIRKNSYYSKKHYNTMFEVVMYFYFTSLMNYYLGNKDINDDMKLYTIRRVLAYTISYNKKIKGLTLPDDILDNIPDAENILVKYFDNFNTKIQALYNEISPSESPLSTAIFHEQSIKVITDFFINELNINDVNDTELSYTIAATFKFVNITFEYTLSQMRRYYNKWGINVSILILLIILLLMALLPLPYGYYILLRFAVFFGLIYEIIKNKKLNQDTIYIFIVIAVLYNPIIRMPLGRVIWVIVNILTAIYLIYCLWKYKNIKGD